MGPQFVPLSAACVVSPEPLDRADRGMPEGVAVGWLVGGRWLTVGGRQSLDARCSLRNSSSLPTWPLCVDDLRDGRELQSPDPSPAPETSPRQIERTVADLRVRVNGCSKQQQQKKQRLRFAKLGTKLETESKEETCLLIKWIRFSKFWKIELFSQWIIIIDV